MTDPCTAAATATMVGHISLATTTIVTAMIAGYVQLRIFDKRIERQHRALKTVIENGRDHGDQIAE